MADNSQNTYAGGGAPLAAPSGNGILDAFTRLANVAVDVASKGYAVYDSIKEREALRDLQRINATTPPQQATPAYQITTPADYFSDPVRVQKTLMAAGSVALLGAGAFWLYKKAK